MFPRCLWLCSLRMCAMRKRCLHTSVPTSFYLSKVSFESQQASQFSNASVSSQHIGHCNTLEDALKTTGLRERFVEKLLKKKPSLRHQSGRVAQQICEVFLAYGITMNHMEEIMRDAPDILTIKPNVLTEIIEIWKNFGLHEKHVFTIFRKCPKVLCLEPKFLSNRFSEISSIFTRKQAEKIIKICPELFLLNSWDHVMEVTNYVKEEMGLEEEDLAKSRCFLYPVEYIKTRHAFLHRTDAYEKPNPKTRQMINNPSLARIIQCTDEEIAKIAKVTVEEFRVFCELYEKELLDSRNEEEDDMRDGLIDFVL